MGRAVIFRDIQMGYTSVPRLSQKNNFGDVSTALRLDGTGRFASPLFLREILRVSGAKGVRKEVL